MARIAISEQMQRQRRLHLLEERWNSSRLGLLTARLLTALDETQIYAILANHLPDFDLQIAWVGIFETDSQPPLSRCRLRNALLECTCLERGEGVSLG